MDILFVRVPNLQDNEYLDLWGATTPDSLLVLASYLDSRGQSCGIVDFYADDSLVGTPADEDMEDRLDLLASLVGDAITSSGPLILGITSLSNGEAWTAVAVAKRVKQAFPRLPIIMGGYFPTNNSKEILESCPFIDGVVVGEGELITHTIVDRAKSGLPLFASDMSNVCYRENGRIVYSRPGPLFELKSSPPLNYSLLNDPLQYQTLAYHTSRGCPWRCNYCLEVTMGERYRTKPNSVVREDILNFKALRDDFFLLLTDPMLAVNDKRLVEVCDVLTELDVSFLFETRVDVLAPELIPVVKRAGCNSIYFGFESASFSTLLRMNKLRPPDYDQYMRYLSSAEELIKACARHRVTPLMGIMVGYPGDTPEDLTCTLDFVRKLRASYLSAVGDRSTGAGFVVSPSEVYIPRSSATWDAQNYFVKLGLEVTGDHLFGDCKVKNASAYLSNKDIMLYFGTLRSLSINPSETLDHSVAAHKEGNMAATMAAKVKG